RATGSRLDLPIRIALHQQGHDLSVISHYGRFPFTGHDLLPWVKAILTLNAPKCYRILTCLLPVRSTGDTESSA
ncbi:hypothetical protein, partial [Paeniglutamicibacter sulfureus]|uniref:hypothetical protein n=1 Tax=Paeniglutamicibacter sulfureus TaxID=43666 RepID=UPI0035E9EA55